MYKDNDISEEEYKAIVDAEYEEKRKAKGKRKFVLAVNETIFEANSGGVRHYHCMDSVMAQKIV